jgi:hypothetical protein
VEHLEAAELERRNQQTLDLAEAVVAGVLTTFAQMGGPG